MKPRSPFVPLHAPRGAFAALLALAIAAVLNTQDPAEAGPPVAVPTVPVRAQPDKKTEPDKKSDSAKQPEFKWPTEINGKDMSAVMKDLEDPDPSIRELAARTLPQFGPAAHESPKVGKLLIKRMKVAFEPDPGVRVAVFTAIGLIQFKDEADRIEAVRLFADNVAAVPASPTRLAAIQALSLFGPKGKHAIQNLTGVAMSDPAYETRRSIAATLGRVGFDELTGPNMNALTALANVLAKDPSAAVRLEALKSLLTLGPPWESVKQDAKDKLPPIDFKTAGKIAAYLKTRVGDPGAKPPVHGLEKDKNVEVWARLALMQFDTDEANEDNLNELCRFLSGTEPGVKAQALQALAILGEASGKKYKDVVRVMEDPAAPIPLVLVSVNTLGAMGAGAKPALPNLKKLLDEKRKPFEAKMQEIKTREAAKMAWVKLTDESFEALKKLKVPGAVLERLNPLKDKGLYQDDFVNEITKVLNPDEKTKFQNAILDHAAKMPFDPQLVGETMALGDLVRTLEAAIDHIDKAKPTSTSTTSDPPKKP